MTLLPFHHEGFGQWGIPQSTPAISFICEFTNHISKRDMVLAQLDILLIAHELGSLNMFRTELRGFCSMITVLTAHPPSAWFESGDKERGKHTNVTHILKALKISCPLCCFVIIQASN